MSWEGDRGTRHSRLTTRLGSQSVGVLCTKPNGHSPHIVSLVLGCNHLIINHLPGAVFPTTSATLQPLIRTLQSLEGLET